MCGIIATTKKNINISGALEALSRRGPDEQGSFTSPIATLAQTRLAVIDLSPTGHQPMTDNAHDIAITFNGEIYNYKTLRAELETKGHRFSTHSDTETILKAYIEWGDECPKHLDGMFAFVIADNEKNLLFLARDRFGKKPLYYHLDSEGELSIASEIKALIELGIQPKIDRSALDNYLQLMYVPPWKSIYTNIHVLPPAHSAVFIKGAFNKTCYWHLEHKPTTLSYEEAKEETHRLIKESVKKRMLTADVEVGSLLSGGVDSTLVSILAATHLDQPLKTFSLGYGDYINELPYAKQVSEKIGSKHYTEQAGGDLIHELEAVIAYFDQPHADSSDFPQHLVSRLAASEVKVSLSGDGADELFLGYGWNTKYKNLSWKKDFFEKIARDPFGTRVRMTRIFPLHERIALWGSPFATNNDIFAEGIYKTVSDPHTKVTLFDLTTYLPGQLLSKVDATSMMHGLEVRSPFLDTTLAEFVFNLPREYKIGHDGTQKRILKDILSEYMPHEFAHRRKQGFGAPILSWLREKKMQEYVQEKLGKDAQVRLLLSRRMLDLYLKDFYEKNHNRAAMRLWILLCLEVWLRTHPTRL